MTFFRRYVRGLFPTSRMDMKSWWLTVRFVFLVLCLGSGLEAAENRVVEIMYDASKGQTDCLYIRVDGTRTSNKCVKIKSDKKGKIKRYKKFDIKPTDNVILMMKWQCDSTARCDTTAADIHYTVMGKARGLNILKIILENLTKLTVSKSQKTEPSPRQPTVSKVNRSCLQILPVKDELVAGGHLIVTFNKKKKNGRVVASSGPWLFQIETPPPRYTVSHGLVITNAAKPDEQKNKGRDHKLPWRLVPAPFTFVNLQPWSGWLYKQWRIPRPYVSVGFQLGSQPFDDLVIGGTLRPEVDGVSVNITVGKVIPMQISSDKKWAIGLSLAF